MQKAIFKLYLFYMWLLPAAATFFLMQNLGYVSWIGIPIFFLGTGIVAVFLSTVISYSTPSKKTGLLLLVLLDGPFFAFMANLDINRISEIVTQAFLIENVAIWISIGYLALYSGRPTKGQLTASVILAAVFLGGLFGIYYLNGFFFKPISSLFFIAIGIAEAVWIKYKILYEDKVVTDPYDTIPFMVGGIFLWLICFVVGGIVANEGLLK